MGPCWLLSRRIAETMQARRLRRVSLRDVRSVRADWKLVCLCGNLIKLVNSAFVCGQLATEVA